MAQIQNQLYLWDGYLLYLTPGNHNDWHRHHAASILMALEQSFELQIRGQQAVECRIALLAPNTENRVNTHEQALAAIMIDADGPLYDAIAEKLDNQPCRVLDSQPPPADLSALRSDLRQLLKTGGHTAKAGQLVDRAIEILSGNPPQHPAVEPRIRQVAQRIRQALPDEVDPQTLADTAGLSRSRLMTLFKQQMGLPIQHYVLWHRLYLAAQHWQSGHSLTDAAMAAGFYDQAHYSRTVKRMLGMAPSMISNPDTTAIHHCWAEQ